MYKVLGRLKKPTNWNLSYYDVKNGHGMKEPPVNGRYERLVPDYEKQVTLKKRQEWTARNGAKSTRFDWDVIIKCAIVAAVHVKFDGVFGKRNGSCFVFRTDDGQSIELNAGQVATLLKTIQTDARMVLRGNAYSLKVVMRKQGTSMGWRLLKDSDTVIPLEET